MVHRNKFNFSYSVETVDGCLLEYVYIINLAINFYICLKTKYNPDVEDYLKNLHVIYRKSVACCSCNAEAF